MIDPTLPEEEQVVSARVLRQFAIAALLVFGALAFRQGFVTHRLPLAITFAILAVLVGGTGLISPERIRIPFMALTALTMPIGRVMTYVLLGVLFYGVVTPLGFVLSLFGRDPLKIARPKPGSQWTPKAAPTDVRDYTRQS